MEEAPERNWTEERWIKWGKTREEADAARIEGRPCHGHSSGRVGHYRDEHFLRRGYQGNRCSERGDNNSSHHDQADQGYQKVQSHSSYTEEEWNEWAAKKEAESPNAGWTTEQWKEHLKREDWEPRTWEDKRGGREGHNKRWREHETEREYTTEEWKDWESSKATWGEDDDERCTKEGKSWWKDRRRNKRRRDDQGKSKDNLQPMPEKLCDQYWEEPRLQTGLKLIRENAPSHARWSYPVCDESRRCYAGFFPNFMDKQTCDMFFKQIQEGTEWKQPLGRLGAIPRKTAWMVTPECTCTYRYGSIEVEPQHYPAWMTELMRVTMSSCGLTNTDDWPNACNLNFYEDGGMSVGWHSDDESLFQGKFRDITIISLSLGVKRKFELRMNWPDTGEKAVRRMLLGNGDLMTMEGMVQKHYQHRVPKEEGIEGSRINLTWRWTLKHRPSCPVSRKRLSQPCTPSAPSTTSTAGPPRPPSSPPPLAVLRAASQHHDPTIDATLGSTTAPLPPPPPRPRPPPIAVRPLPIGAGPGTTIGAVPKPHSLADLSLPMRPPPLGIAPAFALRERGATLPDGAGATLDGATMVPRPKAVPTAMLEGR